MYLTKFLILLVMSFNVYGSYTVSPNPGNQNDSYTFTIPLNDSLGSQYDLKLSLGNGEGGWLPYEVMTANQSRTTFTYQRVIYRAGQRIFRYAIFEGNIRQTEVRTGSYEVKRAEVTDFSPTSIQKDSTQTVTINGTNLPSTMVANIDGSGSCTQNSVSSTQARFSCTPTVSGNKRFYIKIQSGDDEFISGSEDWYVNVTEAPIPTVTDFSPTSIQKGSTHTVTINGTNLPSTMVANIDGSGSCTQNSVSSTQARFSCTPTVSGNKRFYIKVQSGDDEFISGSEDWYVNVTEAPIPTVTDFSPKTIQKDSTETVTISGTNLPSTIVANIDGSESCTQESVSSTEAKFRCTPIATGERRFYIKVQSGDNEFISGSENWYMNVTETPDEIEYDLKTCTEVDTSDPWLCRTEKNNFLTTDNIFGWVEYLNLAPGPHTLKLEYLHPQTNTRRTSSKTITWESDWTYYRYNSFLDFRNVGAWKLKAYLNSSFLGEHDFTVTEDLTPTVSDFSPKTIQKDSTETVTISGTNLPSTIVANINGSESCTQESVSSTQAKFRCTPIATGERRLYIKVQSGDSEFISGSENWYMNVTEVNNTPIVNDLGGELISQRFGVRYYGSFTVYHSSNEITHLRVHYADNLDFQSGNYVDVAETYDSIVDSNSYEFSLELDDFEGSTLYWKVEATSTESNDQNDAVIESVDIGESLTSRLRTRSTTIVSKEFPEVNEEINFECSFRDENSGIEQVEVQAKVGRISEFSRETYPLSYDRGDLENAATYIGNYSFESPDVFVLYCIAEDESGTKIQSVPRLITATGRTDETPPEIEISTSITNNNNKLSLSTLVTDDIQIDRVSFKVFDENYEPIDTSTSINVELSGDHQDATYNFDANTWGTDPSGLTANTDWQINVSRLIRGKHYLKFFASDGVNTTEIEDFLEFEVIGEPTNIPQVSGLATNLEDELLTVNFTVSQSDNLVTGLRLHYSEFEDYRIENVIDIGGSYNEQQETGVKSVSVDVAEFIGRTLYYKIEVYNTEGEQLTPAPSGTIEIPGEITYANVTLSQPSDGVVYSLPGTQLHCGLLDNKCFTKVPVSERLILQANAAPGYAFDSWSISDQSAIEDCNGNACSLKPTQDISVEAQFTRSENSSPRIVDFFPRQIEVNKETEVTIISENVVDALVINIEGTIGHCEAIDFSGSSREKYRCKASSEGNKRLYVKASAGDESFVSGSEYLYVEVLPASSTTPVLWLESIPTFVELDTPLYLNAKVYDADGDLASLQVDWENDGVLDRKVLLSGEDNLFRVPFSYTRTNNDTSPLKIRFIATDQADNQTEINLQLPVIEIAEGAIDSTGYLYAQQMFEEHLECEVPATTSPEVEPATGARVHSVPLLSVKGLLPIDISIAYHSLSNAESILGKGWTIENGMAARIHDDPQRNVTVQWSESSFHRFEKSEGGYSPRNKACRQEYLTVNDEGGYTIEKLDRRRYIFGEFRTLNRIENHLGQSLQLDYDNLGRIDTILDPVTNSNVKFGYNISGLLESVTTRNGRSVSFEYDTDKRLTQITHADGTLERFTYHSSGQIHESFLNGTKVSATQYDDLGRVSILDDALSSNELIRFKYEKSGTNLLVRQNNRNGHELLQEFNDKKLLVREVDQLGQEVTYEYTDRGLVEAIIEKDGGKTQYEYNEFGDITKETLPNQAYHEYFYDNRNLISERNLRGHTRSLQYDEDGNNRLISETDFRGKTTTYDEYNNNAQLLKFFSPERREFSYTYDNGRLKTETRYYRRPDDGEAITKSFGFDVDGFLTLETDFEGNNTSYDYDGRGRETSITYPNEAKETWEYDAWGNKVLYRSKKRNAALPGDENTSEGLEIEWIHNANGELTSIEERYDDEVAVTSFELDGEGRILKETNPINGVTTSIRDALGQVTSETSPTGDTTTRTYSPIGKIKSRTDPRGNTTSFTYTPLYDIDTQTNALDEVTDFGYNAAGQQTSKEVDGELQWRHQFNEEDSIEKVTFADESTNAEVEFDDDNYFTKLERPSDLTREVAPNVMGSPLKEDTSDNISLSWTYDGNQNPTQITNGRGQNTSFTYNTLALPASRTDPEESFEMDYDPDYQLTSLTSESGDIGLRYDGKGRLTEFSNTVEAEYTVKYSHDAADNLEGYGTVFNGIQLNRYAYTYDKASRVKRVFVNDTQNQLASFERDDIGNITQITRSNGIVETFTYDALNRVSSYSLKNASEQILLSIAYTYNKLGQVVSESRTPVAIPPRELLVSEISSYANNGQLEKVGQRAISFDLDGNTSRIGGDSFLYDSRNRLINTPKYDFKYNGLDYRLSRYNSESKATTYFAVAPDIFDMKQTLLQSTNGDVVEFVQSPEGVLAEYHHDTQEFYHLHYDYRGSVIAVSNSSGEIVATFGYLPYGKKFAVDGDFDTPIGWQGRYGAHTEPNGFVYLRSRHYSPELRRFISKDEVRGDITNYASLNRHAYAGGDPINFVDPSGNVAFLVPVAIFIVKEVAAMKFEEATGIPMPTIKNIGKTVIRLGAKKLAKDGVKDSIDIAKKADDVVLALSKPKMIKHHIFNVFRGKSPKSQKYRNFFKKHGIDLDRHTVEITEYLHRSRIHQAGNNWTTRWKRWIDANPNASTKDVYQQGGRMMDDYGISNLPIVHYKKNK